MGLAIHVLNVAPAQHGNLRASCTVKIGADFQGTFEVWRTRTGHIVQAAQTLFQIDRDVPSECVPGPPAFSFSPALMARISELVLKAYRYKCPRDAAFSPDARSLQNERPL